jgi:hypothetical protein
MPIFSHNNSAEREAVRQLAEDQGIGYGNMMNLARDLWRELLARINPGTEGGEFAVGPCVGSTVPCGCEVRHECDWCEGCGWLTEHVKQVKDATNGS